MILYLWKESFEVIFVLLLPLQFACVFMLSMLSKRKNEELLFFDIYFELYY